MCLFPLGWFLQKVSSISRFAKLLQLTHGSLECATFKRYSGTKVRPELGVRGTAFAPIK